MGRLTTRQLARKRGETRISDRAELQPGDLLQNRYRIVGTLGAGGFSSVYQARDMRFPDATKLCAIKEMVITTSDPQLRQVTIKSFEREASMLAMLNHPAIPDVSDYFTEGNRSYLVLELIRGKDLQDWLDETTDLIDQDVALDWMLQLCEALSYLHDRKPQPIVFRDMKPANVMLDQHNNIRLIDFNIAKNFEADRKKGTMIGTEGYSPPEQYRGEATPAGDVYALGATFHHLLTRQDPRLEPPFTFADRPINAVNPNVTPAFEALIMRCLSYNPADRFSDAMSLRAALKLLVRPEAGTTTVVGAELVLPPSGEGEGQPDGEKVEEQLIQTLWEFKCEDEVRRRAAIAQGLVFVGAYDNNLYALSADNGEFRWKFPASDGFGSSPFVHEDAIYIGSADNHLYSLHLGSGRQNWRHETSGPIYSSPAVRFNHVFFGSDDGHFYALRVDQGKLVWKANAYSAVRSSPHVAEDRVFFGTEGGYVFCLELTSGKTKWQNQAKRAVTSSPAVADDIVFVGSLDGQVYAYDANSGFSIWRYRTQRPIVSSPVVDEEGGAVYIGSSDGRLYALDFDTGRKLWEFETEGQVASSPAIWNGAVYFGSTDGYVYSLTLKKGEPRWRFKTGGQVIASPAIANGVVYIGSTDNILYALPV